MPSTSFPWLRIVLTLLAASGAPWAGAQPADPFAECEHGFAAAPAERGSAACFLAAAKRQGQWDEAARRLEARRGRHRDNPWLPLFLGHVHLYRGSEEAQEAYRDATAIAAAGGDLFAEVEARLAWTRFLAKKNHLEDAAAALAPAVRLAEQTGDRLLLAQVRIRQAWQSVYLGRELDVAYQLLLAVEEAVFRDGPEDLRRQWLDATAVVSHTLGRHDDYLSYKQRLLAGAIAAGNLADQASARYDIANHHITAELPSAESRAQARRLFAAALAAAEAAGHTSIAGLSHLALGRLLDGPPGRRHLQSCLAIAADRDDRKLLDDCRGALAASWIEEDPRRARELSEPAPAARSAASDPWVYGWDDRLLVDWATRPREAAVRRSLDLLDAIEALRGSQTSDAGRAGLMSMWTDPYAALSGYLLREVAGRQDLEQAFAVTERMRSRVLLEALAAVRAPAPADPGTLATLGQVEESLGDDEALLSYQLGLDEDFYGRFTGGSWLLVSTRAGTESYRLADDRLALEQALGALLGLDDVGGAAPGLARLHRTLLGDALAHLPPTVERLVIVPDGQLHRLPFALLRPAAAADPLIARFELSTAPSATLWRRWKERRLPASEAPVLALADPLLGAAAGGTSLPPLPGARQEGRAVVAALGGGSRLLVGEEASESFLKQADLRRFAVLHFAAHAVVDEREPERSAVLLAPGAGDDGGLRPPEIVALELDGRVVVLASCEGAGGRVLRGEGVMSLARAFFQAGSPVVVASLWPLPDDWTAAVFRQLYRRLGSGESVAGALAGAQREMIRQGAPAEAWAGLVVLGNGDLVPFPGGLERPRRWLAGLLAAAVLAAAGAALALRRRRAR